MPRMPLCGGLTIGVESIEPKTPPLVMVKVPPSNSSGSTGPSPGGKIADRLFDLGEAQLFGVAHDRHDQPLAVADRDADVIKLDRRSRRRRCQR